MYLYHDNFSYRDTLPENYRDTKSVVSWHQLFVIMPLAKSVVECCQRFVGSAYTIWIFGVFSIIRSWCEAIFSQGVAKEGIRYVPLVCDTDTRFVPQRTKFLAIPSFMLNLQAILRSFPDIKYYDLCYKLPALQNNPQRLKITHSG